MSTSLAAARPGTPPGDGPLRVSDVRDFVAGGGMPAWDSWQQARAPHLDPAPAPTPASGGDPFGHANLDTTHPYSLPDGTRIPEAARVELALAAQRTMALRRAGRDRGWASRAAATAAAVEDAAGQALTRELLGTLAGLVRSIVGGRAGSRDRATHETVTAAAWQATLEAISDFDPARGELPDHVGGHVRRATGAALRDERLPGLPERVAVHAWSALGMLVDDAGRDRSAFDVAGQILADKREQVAGRRQESDRDLDEDARAANVTRQLSRNSGGAVIARELPWALLAVGRGMASVEALSEQGDAWQPGGTDPGPVGNLARLVCAGVPGPARGAVLAVLLGGPDAAAEVDAAVTDGVAPAADLRRWARHARTVVTAPHAQHCYLGGPDVVDAPAAALRLPAGDVWPSSS